MPRTLMKEKPDWHSAEVGILNEVDYYESDRALGHLFRAVKLDIPKEQETRTLNGGTDPSHPLTDAISLALTPIVEFRFKQVLDDESADDEMKDLISKYFDESTDPETEDLFKKYSNELSYIRYTHTVSSRPDAPLQEAEIVVGSILDKCTNKRYRGDRKYAMQNQTSVLVGDIEREFVDKSKEPGRVEWLKGLQRAWKAWAFSQRHNEAGTGSFGLIALGIVLDCLDKLGS
jgi:RNA-dependent RNA polymerase